MIGLQIVSIIDTIVSIIETIMDKIASTLFGKTRQAVLAWLMQSPEEKYYVRELARLAGISPGTVKYELDNLAEADLVTRVKDGNRVVYQANTYSPVHEELRSIVSKTSGIPLAIGKVLNRFGKKIERAFIYGSMAKGTNQSRSDVDLLVVGEVPFATLISSLAPLERAIRREINVRLIARQEFADKLRKRDRFLSGLMKGPLIPVIGEAR